MSLVGQILVLLLVSFCRGQDNYDYYTNVDIYPKIFPNDYGKGYTAPEISQNDIDTAIKEVNTYMTLKNNYENGLIAEKQYLPFDTYSPNIRLQQHYKAKPKYLFESEQYDDYMEKISYRLRSGHKFPVDECYFGLPKVSLEYIKNTDAYSWCQKQNNIKCDANSPYRSSDGTCNNLNNPNWGKAFSCFQRLLPPAYADGISSIRTSKDGSPLPNPRIISTILHTDADRQASTYTHMLMQWGQLMAHDYSFIKTYLANGRYVINCCPTGSNSNGTNSQPDHPQCLPINVPPGDSLNTNYGLQCLSFVRSASCCSCTLGPRQQTNQVTSYMDGSPIYGNSIEEMNSLKDQNDPALLSMTSTGFGYMLPTTKDPMVDQCSNVSAGIYCFSAGDVRVNQHPGITSLQVIFARYHNIVAQRLRTINPNWDPDKLFQVTRKIVTAQIQFISYREYIHLVIGPTMMTYFDLWPHKTGRSSYDPRINPTLFNEFSTSTYRYGHSLVNKEYLELTTSGESAAFHLKDNFFNPTETRNGKTGSIVDGLCRQSAQSFDHHIVTDLTNYLYKVDGENHGLDLASINNQRTRDHGIKGYTAYVKYCFDVDINNFEDLGLFMPINGIERLRSVYKNPQDIDLWTGGLYEYKLRNAVVGPTFGCIIGQQYYYSKFGDRFFVEHGNQAGSFTDNQLNELRKTWLSKILCITSDIQTRKQLDVFQPISAENPELNCNQIPDIDLNQWQDQAN